MLASLQTATAKRTRRARKVAQSCRYAHVNGAEKCAESMLHREMGVAMTGVSGMALSSFSRVDHGTTPHKLVVLAAGDEDWLEPLANRYRELRTATRFPLTKVSLEGIELLDVQGLQARLTASQIAPRNHGNFNVLRSDMSETLLGHIGEDLNGFSFGYQSIRDRETAHLPGRSIDQIGVKLEADAAGVPNVSLMLGEAKVSSQKASPPSVVDSKDDALSKSHIKQIALRDDTEGKILHAARFCTSHEIQSLFTLAAEMFKQDHPQLTIHATSVLVRPLSAGAPSDFGSYGSTPENFEPAIVDFYIVRASSDDLEALADAFEALASTDPATAVGAIEATE